MTLELAFQNALNLHQAGNIARAEPLYRQILASDPQHPGAVHLLGVLLAQSGRLDEGLPLIRRAIELLPLDPAPRANLGSILLQAQRFDDAIEAFRAAAGARPDDPDSHFHLGAALQAAGRHAEAIAAYRRAIDLQPNHAPALNNLAGLLRQQQALDEAHELLRHALAAQPQHVEALGNMGLVLAALGRPADALPYLEHAARLRPQAAEPHLHRGMALVKLARAADALDAYRHALRLDPANPHAHFQLGDLFERLHQPDEAARAYSEALRLKPDFAEAYGSLAVVLANQARITEAITLYRQALAINPNLPVIHSNLLYTLHFAESADPLALLAEHRAWNDRFAAPFASAILPHDNPRDPQRRLRIGYLSPDLRNHSVGRFMLPLLTHHDHAACEIFAYPYGDYSDAMTDRLRALVDHWRPLGPLTDSAAADLIRNDRIDILVDLVMHGRDARPLLFALKPAPLQLAYLAYCSTTGLQAIDYRLSDPHLDPPDSDTSCYTEQTLRLPKTYWCYPEESQAPPVSDLPALRADHITFGCLNTFMKVSDAALALWARILAQVPAARLLLHADPGSHRQRVHQFLADRGLDPARCQFSPRLPTPEYFALYHNLDIALDPFPYAGGTTSCDALWMGVPVITLRGPIAVGRGGVSILSNLALPELIAHTPDDYLRIATNLAADRSRLAALRASLRPRMQSSPLMDAPSFARALEQIYRQIWRLHCTAPPSSF